MAGEPQAITRSGQPPGDDGGGPSADLPWEICATFIDVEIDATDLGSFCQAELDCCPPTPPTTGENVGEVFGGGPAGSGYTFHGHGCNANWTWHVAPIAGSGTTSGGHDCTPPNPDCPPSWWLTRMGHLLSGPAGTLGHNLGIAMLQLAALPDHQRCPPPNLYSLYWPQILSLWQTYLTAHPTAGQDACLGIDPVKTLPPGFARWVTLDFTGRIIRRYQRRFTLQEFCDLCQ